MDEELKRMLRQRAANNKTSSPPKRKMMFSDALAAYWVAMQTPPCVYWLKCVFWALLWILPILPFGISGMYFLFHLGVFGIVGPAFAIWFIANSMVLFISTLSIWLVTVLCATYMRTLGLPPELASLVNFIGWGVGFAVLSGTVYAARHPYHPVQGTGRKAMPLILCSYYFLTVYFWGYYNTVAQSVNVGVAVAIPLVLLAFPVALIIHMLHRDYLRDGMQLIERAKRNEHLFFSQRRRPDEQVQRHVDRNDEDT